MEKNGNFSLFETSVNGNVTFAYIMMFHCTSVWYIVCLQHPTFMKKKIKIEYNWQTSWNNFIWVRNLVSSLVDKIDF